MKTMQNLVTLVLTDAQLTAIDAALDQLDANLNGLVSLTTEQKKATVKAGEKSEAFCVNTLTVMQQNPEVLPINVRVDDALADLRAREQLRPRLFRLTRLQQRAADTDLALGSDAMAMALHGYKLLKANGRGFGLERLQRDFGGRFAKKRRTVEAALAAAPPT